MSFDIPTNATVALVGESGSGKSVSAMSIVRLLPDNAIVAPESQILYNGRDLLKAPVEDMRALRGKDISVVFQEPMSSLNPVFHRRRADRRGAAHPHEHVAAPGHGPRAGTDE